MHLYVGQVHWSFLSIWQQHYCSVVLTNIFQQPHPYIDDVVNDERSIQHIYI